MCSNQMGLARESRVNTKNPIKANQHQMKENKEKYVYLSRFITKSLSKL